MDFVNKIVEALKLGPYVFFAVALATGAILFGSPELGKRLGVDSVLATQRVWIGGAFLLSSALFVSSLLARLWKLCQPFAVERWKNRQRIKTLRMLTPQEQDLLAEFVREGSSTRYYAISNGVVGGLVGKKILWRTSNAGNPGSMSFPFNVQPWAWNYLQEHLHLVLRPELLDSLMPDADEA